MSDKERLQLEQECLLKYSKAQMIEKYIDEFEENIKLSELWCKSQQKNKQLKEQLANDIDRYEDTISYQLGFDKGKEYVEEYKFTIRTQQEQIAELIGNIDRAVSLIEKSMLESEINGNGFLDINELLRILNYKKQEEYTLTPDENGTTQINGEWYRVDKK